MRKFVWMLTIAVVMGARPVGASDAEVVLAASDVSSAADIEAAILLVTAGGIRSGTVVLDARDGSFIYSGADRTINVAHASVSLRSHNGAFIENCDDGVLLEPGKSDHVLIEGISFHCANSGILAPSNEQGQVTNLGVVQRNVIVASGGYGIQVTGGHRWIISGNHVTAAVDAINLSGAAGSFVANNRLIGAELALQLHVAQGNKIINNALEASYQGILLTAGTIGNRITHNRIAGPSHSGISLEDGCRGNSVHGNVVTCATQYLCEAVSGSAETFTANRMSGNKVR